MLICSSLIHSFTKIAQHKWANVSNSLRSLRSTERLWANCSSRSWQMSKYEWFPQVTQDKWANEQIARLFWASHSFSLSLRKNEWFNKKLKILYFLYIFYSFFEIFKKRKRFAHSFWAKWGNCSGHSGQMSDLEQFAQVTQKEWAIMSESLRLLTKNLANEWITHFLSKSLIRSLFGKNEVSLQKSMSEFPTKKS